MTRCCCDVVPRTLEPGQGSHHGAGPRLGDHGAVSPRHLAAARGLGLDLLSTLYLTTRGRPTVQNLELTVLVANFGTRQ